MLKNFMMKKMLQSKLKELPADQQEKILGAFEKNPELFEKIGKEIQKKMKDENKSQMAAAMEVMRAHQGELQKLMK